MPSMSPEYIALLDRALDTDFVPHLPTLLIQAPAGADVQTKNRSRALAAYALTSLCEISPQVAAASVTDDFDDFGLDAIYYDAKTETLFLVQAKRKTDPFSQVEALAFCQGVRKLLGGDTAPFNQHVQRRLADIEGAVYDCSNVQLVVAHTSDLISVHANEALNELLVRDQDVDDRLLGQFEDFGPLRIIDTLSAGMRTRPSMPRSSLVIRRES